MHVDMQKDRMPGGEPEIRTGPESIDSEEAPLAQPAAQPSALQAKSRAMAQARRNAALMAPQQQRVA